MKDSQGNKLKVGDKVAVAVFIKIGDARITTGIVTGINKHFELATVRCETKYKEGDCYYSESIIKL